MVAYHGHALLLIHPRTLIVKALLLYKIALSDLYENLLEPALVSSSLMPAHSTV